MKSTRPSAHDALAYAIASSRLEGIEPNPAMTPAIIETLEGRLSHDRFMQIALANAAAEAAAARPK